MPGTNPAHRNKQHSSIELGRKEAAFIPLSPETESRIQAYENRIRELQKRIEELELQNIAENSLLSVGDNLIDGICVVNLRGRIVSVNKSYTQLTEHGEEEVVGHEVQELLKAGKIRTCISLQVMEERKKISVLCASPHRDKTYLVTGLPLFDKDGSLKGAMTILRDMTEITGIAHSLRRCEGAVEQEDLEFRPVDYEPTRPSRLIGENLKIRKLKELIQYIARNDSTVLLQGETGTGKEVVSREIHELSARVQNPYIKINCGALPESLIESELFGYERGAFTGAQNKAKPGMFELANGGTLLLDEITDLPLSLQSKLLRVLQEREVRRLGGTQSIRLDVRIIASTNKDFHTLIRNGEFRSDLYYRLNVVPIHLVPLRDRNDDIPLFVKFFLETFNRKYATRKIINSQGIALLKQYAWPGNVRELENMMERIVASMPDEQVTIERIEELILEAEGTREAEPPEGLLTDDPDSSLKRSLNSFEKELLASALKTHGSTYKAAKALGVSQSTVFRKASLYGLLNGARD